MSEHDLKAAIRQKYGEAALMVFQGARASCCESGAAGSACDPVSADLYERQETAGLPEEALEASLGCGNPTALAELQAGETVLDLGCGGGVDVLLAARRVGPAGWVLLYDINPRMIAAGLPKLRAATGGAAVRPVVGNAEEIACREGAFDAAMVGFGIRNVTRMRRAFAEMHRVLRPGGRLLCLEFSRPRWAWFRFLYDLYSFRVMPVLGERIAGSRQAYTHLPESIRTFPLPGELARLLRAVGFRDVAWRPFTNGIAVAHLATR